MTSSVDLENSSIQLCNGHKDEHHLHAIKINFAFLDNGDFTALCNNATVRTLLHRNDVSTSRSAMCYNRLHVLGTAIRPTEGSKAPTARRKYIFH